ncbi:MAG: Uma2 family endonuclease, partial [Methylococcaceae bacterium]|nr:Uma2 family endonuclease [Methylococcaceae bacterium]
MAQTQTVSDFYSVEEYLSLEEHATERSEYYNGEIFTMAGGTPEHNQISGNLYAELNFALKKKDFRVYISDIKLWVPQKNSFLYPDVLIIKGEPELYNNSKDILLNPVVIIEVLSDSTKDYDRNEKFAQYRSLESLQEYILV